MLKIYNSLTRKIETFEPLRSPHVGMYTCGPTVYDFAHIGNFRTYTTSDILLRTLTYQNFDVKYVMNITDVGHLTGDNLGDADTGEDRMEKSAKKEGKTAWEIAQFYTDAFLKDYKALNLIEPIIFTKATDHIKEQIALINRLEQKGYAYETSDGIYFDTAKFKEYGKLSNLDQIKEGARVEVNPEKRNPRDFALWKFSYPRHSGEQSDSRIDSGPRQTRLTQARMTDVPKRQMEWDSPWGKGFPGWHIECSAMSMKYLGESFDLHVGGIDLRETHHPNEIAQVEAATGKPFVKYWVHSAFVLVQGERMSKSLGNNYKLYDLEKKGFDPLSVRYLYLQTHYRQEMNFTIPSLEAASQALTRLREHILSFENPVGGSQEYEKRFLEALNDDLNTPQAIAVMWELVKSKESESAKSASILKMDKVLGLDLKNAHTYLNKKVVIKIPASVQELLKERESLRKQRKFTQADQIRTQVKKLGYDITDTKKGTEVKKLQERN